VAEELRFFLRTAAYSAVISVIYWFASYQPTTDTYDAAGTVMLAFTALASATVVAALIAGIGRRQAMGATPVLRVDRLIGFGDPDRQAEAGPLGAGLEPIPVGSVWPIAAGVAALLIGFGLVFGAWLLLPGVALAASSVWGWISEG
jgi:hypothetical protein